MATSEIVLNKILGGWCFVLIVFGTIGNFVCFLICMRKRLRCTPTFVLLGFMSLSDIISLYGWNLDHFIEAYFGYVLEDEDVFVCKIVTIYQCTSLQASAMFLVLMSIERYLSVRIKFWRKNYCNLNRSILASVSLIVIIFILNSHSLITFAFVGEKNETIGKSCYADIAMFAIWRYVHTIMYSVIPFLALVFINILLLRHIILSNNRARSTNTRSRQRNISLSILVMTALFFLLTFPSAVVGNFLQDLRQTVSGLNILYFCNCFGYSYHSSNFIVFLLVNRQFRREVKRLFKLNRNGNNTHGTVRNQQHTFFNLNQITNVR